MRFGLDIAQQRMPWQEVADRARFADELGFDGIWGFDHFQPMYGDGPGRVLRGQHDARGVERHHRARPPRPARHRDDLPSPVGVRGRGDHDRPRVGRPARARRTARRGSTRSTASSGIPFPPLKERVDAFEEAVQIVRGLLTTDGFTFEGTHFQVARRDAAPAAGAAAAPADLDRRVGREAHDADRGALRRRVALLRPGRAPRRRSRSGSSAMAGDGRPRPGEIRRAASLSLEDDLDTIAAQRRRVGGRRLRVPRLRLARPAAAPTVEAFAAPLPRLSAVRPAAGRGVSSCRRDRSPGTRSAFRSR